MPRIARARLDRPAVCTLRLYIDRAARPRYGLYMKDVQKARPMLSVDVDGDVPVVQQITRGLRRCLLDGTLAPGDLLPSSRALARDLGVHFNTVAQAYRELEREGWLVLTQNPTENTPNT